jgi:hypothetical protein
MAPGSATRGSSDPQPPATTLNGNTNRKYWNNQNKTYILEQLKLSGWDPPHPDIDKIYKKDLLAMLFKLRNIPENKTQQTPQINLNKYQTRQLKRNEIWELR